MKKMKLNFYINTWDDTRGCVVYYNVFREGVEEEIIKAVEKFQSYRHELYEPYEVLKANIDEVFYKNYCGRRRFRTMVVTDGGKWRYVDIYNQIQANLDLIIKDEIFYQLGVED